MIDCERLLKVATKLKVVLCKVKGQCSWVSYTDLSNENQDYFLSICFGELYKSRWVALQVYGSNPC